MTAGEQRDEQPLEHRVLADDHTLELIQCAFEPGARILDLLHGFETGDGFVISA